MSTPLSVESFDLKLKKKMLIKVLNNDENIVAITHESIIKYIEDNLTLEDRTALILLLREDIDTFLECNSANITKAQEAKGELLKLLRNIEPNAGDDQGNPGHQESKVEWGVVPKFSRFKGVVSEGHSFLESFKSLTRDTPEEGKVQTFCRLIEGQVLTWFNEAKLTKWEDIERHFVKTWCLHLSSTEAIIQANKFYQKENEHIGVYAAEFEELRQFF